VSIVQFKSCVFWERGGQPDPSPQSAAAHVKPFSRQPRDSHVLSSMGVSQRVAKLKESAQRVGGGGGGCTQNNTQSNTDNITRGR
jgi:hypothetical protein